MFDSQADADRARTQLLSAGFAADSITMTGGTSPSETASSQQGSSRAGQEDQGVISRFFQDLFGSDDHASRDDGYAATYQEAFRRGSYGVRVSALDDDEVDRAERILNAAGAVDVDERAQSWRQEGWSGGAAGYQSNDTSRTTPASTLDDGATRTLKEVEEELKVGKRTVARGGVRIFTRVVEVPVEESVTLREERAEVTRRAVDRPATEADLAAFKEGSIEVRESAEEAVVSKSARVTGEVEVGKTVTEREETVRDTVRQTRVDVEEIEGGRGGSAGAVSPQREAVLQGGSGSASALRSGAGSMAADLESHPVATGTGAIAGGVAAGAAVGTVAGPVGTAVGAAVGAVAGGLAGKGVAESVDDDEETEIRNKPL
jgi:uncharacterized protein (TIGR02271 family)